MPRHDTNSGSGVRKASIEAPPVPLSVVIHSSRPAILDAVSDFAARLERELDSDETIIDALIARPNAPGSAHVEQLRANAELRLRFLREVPSLDGTDVRSQPTGLKAERRVFSVSADGIEHYPLFQFTSDGQPQPVMQDILAAFAGLSDWQVALWFFAPNAWLGNEPPMNVLQRDPQAVISAAQHAIEPLEV